MRLTKAQTVRAPLPSYLRMQISTGGLSRRPITGALPALRMAALLAVLLLVLAEPRPGRAGVPDWTLLLLFAAYGLTADLVALRGQRDKQPVWRYGVDITAAALVYFLGGGPGSPLFAPVFLSVASAALGSGLRAGILYTVAGSALVAGIDAASPLWAGTPAGIREVGTRVVLLLAAGIGAAVLARRLALEQAAARKAVEEAERLKERDRERGLLLSGVSHGLRTPFTAVRAGIGLVESSAGDRLRPDERQLLCEVQSSAERLGIRIRDLLSFNQLEAGAMVLERKPTDLRAIVADAITVVHPLIVEKGQVLEVDLPEPLPLMADEKRLIQVVVNLIDNAHQHTPPGTRLAVRGTASAREVHLAVTDSGAGIPAEQQEAIFEHFHSYDRVGGGWGLGLAVARAMTELHEGQIRVESAPGQGATFHVILPRLDDQAEGGVEPR